MTQKKLPIGIKSFDKIINNNYIYADKTGYIYDLVTDEENSNFFLSRPRRFGKTLLIRTLKELFSGRRELFQGLLIDKLGYDFPKRAVISLSLSTNSDTKEIFEHNLMIMLKEIAEAYNVSVPISTSAQYFDGLIKAVSKKTNSQVAVLIDEYDAPVTRNMANVSVATENAKVLHDFFAKLKVDEVADCVAFTLITGVTRCALNSMDSGANHLNDISLAPEYDGICGFTIPEFDALFADRLEETLESLKNIGKFTPDAKPYDLRKEIFRWYNGYDWGGNNRVLNPFSILHFFKNKSFAKYWIESGLLTHLTALIKARPWDFIDLKLDSYLSETIRKTELNKLEIAPVLFHSGYLTLNRPPKSPELDQKTDDNTVEPEEYSFRLPNYEISSSYYNDCFDLFMLRTDELKAKKEELIQAFLSKDGSTVSSILSSFFGSITFFQKPKGESSFHAFVQLILKAMDFQVDSELAGAAGRLDIGLRLANHNYLIIELRYCPETNKLTEDEINHILAAAAETQQF
ncbi:MAG: AAA family ATPase [Deltaproteobacteria bacterium]|jgi:hypothetical protein|nr:AAA family ATPase [Deltaproteobacteria bacterium]